MHLLDKALTPLGSMTWPLGLQEEAKSLLEPYRLLTRRDNAPLLRGHAEPTELPPKALGALMGGQLQGVTDSQAIWNYRVSLLQSNMQLRVTLRSH